MTEPVDMQATVDRLAVAIGHSVLIEDVDQYPVWWSTVGAVDRTRMRTIVNRHVDPAAAAVIARFNLAEAVGPVRTPTMPDAGMWARWCVPIRHKDQLLGFVWVLDPDRTVSEDHLPMLVECAELAAESMAHAQQTAENTTRRRDELIDRLLAAPDPDAARALARLEGLPSGTRVQVYAPAITGGWPLPNSMSAHVADTPARSAMSGTPLPLAELGEAVRRATATRRAIAAGARIDPAIVGRAGRLAAHRRCTGLTEPLRHPSGCRRACPAVEYDLDDDGAGDPRPWRRHRRCGQGVARPSHHALLPHRSDLGTDRR